MKQYLIDTFKFNDWANKTILKKVLSMPQANESVRLFSHLINSQNKWMARIIQTPEEAGMDWFEPVYDINELKIEWNKSINEWLSYLEKLSGENLEKEIRYTASNGAKLGAKLQDIALQLNYHSIHHRAQICTQLRKQDIEPPFIEYIGKVVKKY